MPPKGEQKSKSAKAAAAANAGKGRKKKWSKGKQKEKVNNNVIFDESTYEKLLAEVPTYRMITPSVLADRLKINGSLARASIKVLVEKGVIREVTKHSKQIIYTRSTNV
eukprot:g4492.t1